MLVTTNFKERVKTAGLLVMQSYKILMGTMTSLFVPQKCFDDKLEEQLCTINDNLYNDDYTQRMTLIFNSLTAFTFLLLYVVEMNRENWLIKHLDIDHSIPDDNLKNIVYKQENIHLINNLNMIEKDKKHIKYLSTTLMEKNRNYFYFSIFTTVVFTVNNLASLNILYDRHYGSATLNTYLSFLMLILVKLYNSLSVSYRSKRDLRALSAYMIEFSSFNSLDQQHYEDFDNENNDDLENNNSENNKKETIELIRINIDN